MDKQLMSLSENSIKSGLKWLAQNRERAIQIEDLSAHYKAVYLYATLGKPIDSKHYAHLMKYKYQQLDGDFRTSLDTKGWDHLPCSPLNRYVYSNGWIILGLRKLGVYDTAQKGVEFLLKFQSKELGGFYSQFNNSEGKVIKKHLDSSSTSSAGLALLSCGYVDEAKRAGDFILKLIRSQPEPDKYYFSSWESGSGLTTDVWDLDEDQNSIYGRKQYCLSTLSDPENELTWLIGKPMKFLCKLYDQTGDSKYLSGAIWFFDFFHKLSEGKWDNFASCKVMWGSAEIYRHTGEERFKKTAEQILRVFCEGQEPSGIWVHKLWYKDEKEQPFNASLDIVQELCGEIADTIFDLS